MLNVQRTVRQFIAAGAKGCILEDQKWPKKSGSMRGKEVIGLEEHVAKVGCLLTELQLCPAWEGEHCSVVQERWLQVALCAVWAVPYCSAHSNGMHGSRFCGGGAWW